MVGVRERTQSLFDTLSHCMHRSEKESHASTDLTHSGNRLTLPV